MKTINERISHCITVTGLTKTAFARKINLSQPHISKIALGHTSPTDRTISDICREFNISETWLRTGEGEMFASVPEATADRLAKEYGLDDLGRQIMSAYLKLDEGDRLAVGHLIQNIIGERAAPADTRSREEKPVTEWTEEEINAEAEEYRQSLLEEKRRAGSGSASASPSSSGTA
ncbi:helix-turn-helix transcriptional regulator [Oscillospiraceae bacterium 38-13]